MSNSEIVKSDINKSKISKINSDKVNIVNKNITGYNIKINEFEGPLDTLLYLITKNKMSIFDINLNLLTDEYINYLETMNKFDMDIASEFIVLASTLLNIKSKKLLPEIEEKEDEEEISEEEMIARIITYKKYKEVSNKIKEMYLSNFGCFITPFEKINYKVQTEYLGDKFTKLQLNSVYIDILNRNVNKVNKQASNVEKLAVYEKYTVKQKTEEILNFLKSNNSFKFNDLFGVEDKSSAEIVTAFLSTLELNKLNEVKLIQDKAFSDINVVKNK